MSLLTPKLFVQATVLFKPAIDISYQQKTLPVVKMSKAKEGIITVLLLCQLTQSFSRSELYLCSVPDNRCPGVSQLISTRSFVIMYEEKVILQNIKTER